MQQMKITQTFDELKKLMTFIKKLIINARTENEIFALKINYNYIKFSD